MKPLPPRVTLLVILGLFTLPLALAWMMNSGSIPYRSADTVNLGRLVSPVVPLDWSSVEPVANDSATAGLDGFWVILYAIPPICNEGCLAAVTQLRQVHRASGRDQNRIKIALLVEPSISQSLVDELLAIDPQFNLVESLSGTISRALAQAVAPDPAQGGQAAVYLVDPVGNIMMTYNGKSGPNRLSKDLKRLLTWSTQDKHS